MSDVPERSRWEARLDGELAGWAEYRTTDELVVFSHTEVLPAFEGRGVGSALVRTSLTALRADGRRALVVCPFYNSWLARHPEYQDLTYQSGGGNRGARGEQ